MVKAGLVDGDEILYVIASAQRREGQLAGGVVGTVMSNLGLEIALQQQGIEFERAQVGDRYVHQLLKERGWVLGGEASGHILCLDKMPTGDAIVSALQVLAVLAAEARQLDELVADMQRFPQVTINVPVADAELLANNPVVAGARAEVERELGSRGRLILRPSGTEPLIRVTVEGENDEEIQRLARQLAGVVEEEFGL